MTNATSIAQALPCQRRVAVQWVTAGILLPGWANGAQAQVALSGAISHAGRFRALSQRMAKAYCQQHLTVMPAAAADVMANARKLVQQGSAELARGSQSGQWPADVVRQVDEVQKQFALLDELTAVPTSRAAVVADQPIIGER